MAFAWAPVNPIFELGQRAKQLAQHAIDEGQEVQSRACAAKTTVLNVQERLIKASLHIPTTVGESLRRLDAAWPGGHTRRMYDSLSRRQASILAQLRTGMTPLNGYLRVIGATETSLCDCGKANESRQHFVFQCAKWNEQRKIIAAWIDGDNLARLLGGKVATDTDDWKPDMDAVRAVIHFTLATKRFEHDTNERWRTMR